ncbi:hypothetical protein Ac2012v2_007303 [Leucoagaricus gongylophorus]
MTVTNHRWITAWFLITAPVILWDASYCFMRALDQENDAQGGDLHWIWRPYALYQEIDYVYGLPALESNDGFTNAQCVTFLALIFRSVPDPLTDAFI